MAGDLIEIRDPRFKKLIHGSAGLDQLWTGGRWCEGPAYLPAGRYLVWSDIPNDRLLRWDETSGAVSVLEAPCRNQNGHTVDAQGRLIACEHRGRCVSRIEPDGRRTVLADRFEGKRLNSPNDVVVKSDGSVWFTDPTYGIDSEYEGDAAASEIGSSNVYRIDPRRRPSRWSSTRWCSRTASPSRPTRTIALRRRHRRQPRARLRPGHPRLSGRARRPLGARRAGLRHLRGRRLRRLPGATRNGNLWTSAGDGVHCFAADGTLLGKIRVPEVVANVAFGGPKRNRLFITATTSLFAIYVNARGCGI